MLLIMLFPNLTNHEEVVVENIDQGRQIWNWSPATLTIPNMDFQSLWYLTNTMLPISWLSTFSALKTKVMQPEYIK